MVGGAEMNEADALVIVFGVAVSAFLAGVFAASLYFCSYWKPIKERRSGTERRKVG